MMKDFTVYYNFKLPDGSEEGFHLRLDPETLELRGNTPAVSPEWTKLDFHQCPNCPLKVEEHPDCPLALRLVSLVQRFDGLLSHEKVDLEVVTEERTTTQKTTVQRGIGSLMGLVIAASGCPHTALLRPMARFHLPLASNEETVYRATSMYLLAQYFLKKEGDPIDLDLDGLTRMYENMQIINVAIAQRLRAATTTDSSVNAIVVLDVYAKTVELVIEGSLERIRYIFAPYFPNRPPGS
jgi:hypothetical protein